MLRKDKLGEGTFGIVYSCTSPNSRKEYAVKRNLIEDQVSFIGVARELDVLNKLRNHKHLSNLEKVAFDEPFKNNCFSPLMGNDRKSQKNDNIHFVFGKADYDLHSYIHEREKNIIDFSLAKKYMLQILLGLEYMHMNKIIHRDLKPSNILIYEKELNLMDQPNIIKICDFGLAKPHSFQGNQTINTVTSWYRAPEIALGSNEYDYKIDIWSAGCIFFEMIAGIPLLTGTQDNNNDILSKILANLPNALSTHSMRKLIRSNPWRKIELKPFHNPKHRTTFKEKLNLTVTGEKKFNQEAGNLNDFCDLLNHMLTFEWENRYNVAQCLNHQFFSQNKDIISIYRDHYKKINNDYKFKIQPSIERKWMADVAVDIFNNRHNLIWYSHRILFQAMDIFDRFLFVMFKTTTIHSNSIESQDKGLIYDEFNTKLRFWTCIYLCIKYFSSIHTPIRYEDIVIEKYATEKAKLVAQQFEGGLIKNCLEYNIYRPTIYEIADDFNLILEEYDIRSLIILYSRNNSFSDLTPTQLFQHYINFLRDKDISALLYTITL